jgi:hypothetical protein
MVAAMNSNYVSFKVKMFALHAVNINAVHDLKLNVQLMICFLFLGKFRVKLELGNLG